MKYHIHTTSVVVRDQGVTIEAEWPDHDPEEVLSALSRAYEAITEIINNEKKRDSNA